jgi:hypothetical protein
MSMTRGLPVAGYTDQPQEAIDMVNANKQTEERLLRLVERMQQQQEGDQRWLAIAKTDIQRAFMSLNRAIFRPERVRLDGDPG